MVSGFLALVLEFLWQLCRRCPGLSASSSCYCLAPVTRARLTVPRFASKSPPAFSAVVFLVNGAVQF